MVQKQGKPIVIITGSEGSIGRTLSAALQKDYRVVGFDKEGSDCDIPIDLTSDPSVTLAFKRFEKKYGHKIVAVIHLAAYFDFTGEYSPLYETVNVKGTKRLLRALQGFEVERFIFSGTMLVHEACEPGETINEDTAIAPKWIYPMSKIKAEQVIRQHHGKIPYLILRLAGLYDDTYCIPTLAHQIARVYERTFKSHLYSGNVKAGQSFIHQEDLIDLFKKAIEYRHDLSTEEVILAGEPEAVSYEKLQDQIVRLIHAEKAEVYQVPPPIAKAGAWLEEQTEPIIPDDIDRGEKPFIRSFMIDLASDHYALNISKARQKLHWEPKHTIKESLPKIIDSLKKDPKTWYQRNGLMLPDWMLTVKEPNLEKMRVRYETEFRKAHQENLWAHFLNIGFGFWLITSPPTLGYLSNALVVSDIISGVLIVLFGFLCLSWRLAWARWLCAGVGIWLIFAPLFFWAPTASAYLNDTLIGSLVIGFSILVRPDVGVAPNAVLLSSDIPVGWKYSPSSWFQRIPIIILAYIGLFISRYMAAYQLGHIDGVWEPFFLGHREDPKNGTEEIITSYVSEAWPVPDAGLGATVYVLEILTGIIGGVNRWRTMPWLVLFFGVMIVPLGVVSITFIIIQPILLDTWCTLCLIAAVAMLIQVPYSFDELIATSVFLWRRWKAGRPLLRILFVGDIDEAQERNQAKDDFEQSPKAIIKEMLTGGITLPWNLMLCLVIGVWLMFTRLTLDASGGMANADHLIGSLIITVTVSSLAEVARALRLLNLFFALALFITPFVYDANLIATLASIIAGGLLFILTIPRGKIVHSYGGWDKAIF
ncbi:NAD dependent epimerase/dehydratase, UDP-glucose-4-epimerase [Legionella lansingensis]|uniref:NAD dependent epimerase/dehydratase n=1 Tax=Legionella lansingensis TaxID=45067 RepID=A0A0W0VFX2_9GAMM|nr:vitamin K epoxide reductase family protein [Legionella lansingensis]KTD18797.1 NAD dependent epimerase/dehydratase [Legionella lansingensis]SNV43173.1 NAD dependent epimerase/dehydratase, UDP-glucose-4-epimerase [Legionella lansingensis]